MPTAKILHSDVAVGSQVRIFFTTPVAPSKKTVKPKRSEKRPVSDTKAKERKRTQRKTKKESLGVFILGGGAEPRKKIITSRAT